MLKEILYDWGGYNISLFKFFNSTFGGKDFTDALMAADVLGEPSNFYFYLFVFSIIALRYLHKHSKSEVKFEQTFTKWFQFFAATGMSFIALYFVLNFMKDYFHIARPYCTENIKDTINTLQFTLSSVSCNRSFPSGHFAFVCTILTLLWPLLRWYGKVIAVLLGITIGVSRMASGAHFPADLVGSFVVCVPMVTIVRFYTNKIVDRLHHPIYMIVRGIF